MGFVVLIPDYCLSIYFSQMSYLLTQHGFTFSSPNESLRIQYGQHNPEKIMHCKADQECQEGNACHFLHNSRS